MLEGCAKAGRPIDVAHTFKQQLKDTGFTDVVETVYKWPGNRWPKDSKYKELGMYCTLLRVLLDSHLPRPLCTLGG